jgi:hypothetical protein
MQSMPVLAYVHQRTTELKNQFGAGFYPQFCATEVAKKTGIDKEKVHSHLEDLTGILAKVDVSYTIYHGESGYHIITPRWIIPRSRTTLVNQILQS